jgi:hypothetical protein
MQIYDQIAVLPKLFLIILKFFSKNEMADLYTATSEKKYFKIN